MNNWPDYIPPRIAMILVGFFAGTISEAEHDELDDWIDSSDTNMHFFDDCVEQHYQPSQLHAGMDSGELGNLPPLQLN